MEMTIRDTFSAGNRCHWRCSSDLAKCQGEAVIPWPSSPTNSLLREYGRCLEARDIEATRNITRPHVMPVAAELLFVSFPVICQGRGKGSPAEWERHDIYGKNQDNSAAIFS